MNKKVIIGLFAVAVIGGGAYFSMNNLETKVEAFVSSQIAQTPFQVEEINYDSMSDTLELKGLYFEENEDNIDAFLRIKSVSIKDFNQEILEISEGIPLVFGNLDIQDITYDIQKNKESILAFKLDSAKVENYAQNLVVLMEEFNKDAQAESFFNALLQYGHDGMILKNLFLEIPTNEDSLNVKIDEIKLDGVEDPRVVSYHYKNMLFSNNYTETAIGLLRINEWHIPSANALSALAENISQFATNSAKYKKHDFLESDFITKMYNLIFSDEIRPFESILFEDSYFKLKKYDDLIFTNDIVALEKALIELDLDSMATLKCKIDDFSMSSDFAALFLEENSVNIVKKFIGDRLHINAEVENVLDLKTKILTQKAKFSSSNLSKVENNNVIHFGDQPVWSSLLLIADDYKDIRYEKISQTFKDKGLMCLVANLASDLTNLPLESLVGLANSELENMKKRMEQSINKATQDESSQESTEMILEPMVISTLNAGITMLNAPGTIEFQLSFNPPVLPEEFIDSILSAVFGSPVDLTGFEFEISAKPGDKTIVEQTAEILEK